MRQYHSTFRSAAQFPRLAALATNSHEELRMFVHAEFLIITIRSDPLPSCLCFELLAVTDSLAIRVATVPISIPFSVQSKISERFQVL